MYNVLQNLFPETNSVVASKLFVLEVGLRELIIETLSAKDGPRWYRSLLPADITQKYLKGRLAEQTANWTTHVEHHPLYYIDFPDLAKVLEKNWNATFGEIFADKSVLLGSLKSLEPIRNKLAHNRKLSESDHKVVDGVLTTFVSAIGEGKLASLVRNCSDASSIPQILGNLIISIAEARDAVNDLSPCDEPVLWHEVRTSWWFDSNFLCGPNHKSKLEGAEARLEDLRSACERSEKEIRDLRLRIEKDAGRDANSILTPIENFFALLSEYRSLPRGRGKGASLESWRNQASIHQASETAISALHQLKGTADE